MRRVFVTGAGHGIGRAIVEAFVKEGDRVAFCDIDTTRGEEVATATGARFFALDVCDKAALEGCVQRLLEEWGDLDIIVNNVGIGGFEPITATTVDHFEMILNTNLRSAFITSRLLAMHRAKMGATNPYGRIVNLCSTRYLQSEAGTEAYAASKGGIWSLTHALAVSLASYHITVNCIAPGVIMTDMMKDFDGETIQSLREETPLNALGTPKDIADAAVFLCSDKAKFITGQVLGVNGGFVIL